MIEEWRDIKGYEGLYKINNVGMVKRLKYAHGCSDGSIVWIDSEKELSQSTDGKGYKFVRLSNGCGKRKHFRVHRLVYETFKSDIPDGFQIDHIDRNKANNSIENLRVVTGSENCRNTSKNRELSCYGITMCVASWADYLNVDPKFLEARLLRGWSDEQTIMTPKLNTWDRHKKVNA